jgi:hypothetical protein
LEQRTDLDKKAAEKLASLLSNKLSVDDAVQIALLNNRELQGFYADLGVAQADLVQAGLLSNPVFDAAIKWPAPGGGRPDLEFATVMNFLDIFYLPLRKRVAAARFEEAKTRVSGMVLDFAGRVRRSFYSHQANQQTLELRQTIVQTLNASCGWSALSLFWHPVKPDHRERCDDVQFGVGDYQCATPQQDEAIAGGRSVLDLSKTRFATVRIDYL